MPFTHTLDAWRIAYIYPSPALVDLADPLEIAREIGGDPSPREVVTSAAKRISDALDQATTDLDIPEDGPVDERWYWIAPLILDADLRDQEAWLRRANLSQAWTGVNDRSGGAGFEKHIDAAVAIFKEFQAGDLRVGVQPDDLAHVLAMFAIGSPGNTAYRALRRLTANGDGELDWHVRDAAARMAWGFRSLFNTVEVTQLLRGLYKQGPYWQKALRYAIDGCLQSVLDEYLFVLKEFEGIVGDIGKDDLAHLAESVADVVSLRSADLQAHDLMNEEEAVRMRVRFALPFGQRQSEDETHLKRSGFVRTAFNSPFWPFVLSTTSVGQEGLDFHLYCHAVVHWNLPSNPVDLEQREGRVHRYMGHAVRKNLAAKHHGVTDRDNLWPAMLASAEGSRNEQENDLVPYWIYPGPSRIERHVLRLPLSREDTRLPDLLRSVVLYRLLFGQARQQELIEVLKRLNLSGDQIREILDKLLIDLSPQAAVRNET